MGGRNGADGKTGMGNTAPPCFEDISYRCSWNLCCAAFLGHLRAVNNVFFYNGFWPCSMVVIGEEGFELCRLSNQYGKALIEYEGF